MNLHSDAILFPRILTAAAPCLSERMVERIGAQAQMTSGEIESGLIRARLAFERIANHFLGSSTQLQLAHSGGVSLALQDQASVTMPKLSYSAWLRLNPRGEGRQYQRYLACVRTLETVVLAHVLAGVDVSAPEYLAGVDATIRQISTDEVVLEGDSGLAAG